MSHKGYALESEVEDFFLSMTGQTKRDPILKADKNGLISVNRTFRIPVSGAMESMKGDVLTAIPWLTKQFKVECKSRRTKNKKDGQIMLVEREWICKNEEEANEDNQIPLLCFSFKGVKYNRIWWILREIDLTTYIGKVSNITEVGIQQGKTLKFIYNRLKNNVYRYEDKKNKVKYVVLSNKYIYNLLLKLKGKKNV